MSYDPYIHRRRSIRLPAYNYSWAGMYFVTIIVRGRQCLFGEVEREQLRFNEAGEMVQMVWLDLPQRFPFCEVGEWVVMPNHFHGVLVFEDNCHQETISENGTRDGSLGRVIQAFKSLTTNAYIEGVKQKNWLQFERNLWLRNYWERIIRNEKEWQQANIGLTQSGC